MRRSTASRSTSGPYSSARIASAAVTTVDTSRRALDLLDPEWYRAGPHGDLTWARANEPVYRDDRNELWGMTRHADVLHVERHSEIFSSKGTYRAVAEPYEMNMIANDDPRHQQQRRLVAGRFTPRAVSDRYGDVVGAIVRELVDTAAPRGEMEVIHDLAGQLPGRTTAHLLGLPQERWEDVKGWSERLMRIDMRLRDPNVMEDLFHANVEFATEFLQIFADRRTCPMDDLASVWANAVIDGEPLDDMTLIHEVGLFIAGGAETTRTLIAHGLRAFCDHPDQWELLAREPRRIPLAIEELLRWVTPLNNFFRTALVDTEVGGQPIAAGERVVLLYPSANRDEAVFERPFEFDVTRDPNPHLAFGNGTHFCLGANFARLSLRTVFETLTERITNLRVVTEPDIEPNIFARAVRSFTLGFDPRPR